MPVGDFSHRGVTEIPREILQADTLETLDLSGNHIEELPPEIGSLVHLTCLRLGGNRLRSLPPEIGRLTNLQTLDLSGNRLSSLPQGIGLLPRLERLIVHGNPERQFPPDIAQYTTAALLHLQEQAIFPLGKTVRDTLFFGAPLEMPESMGYPVFDVRGTEPLRFPAFHKPPDSGSLLAVQGMVVRRNNYYAGELVMRLIEDKLRTFPQAQCPAPYPTLALIAARAGVRRKIDFPHLRFYDEAKLVHVYDVRLFWCRLS